MAWSKTWPVLGLALLTGGCAASEPPLPPERALLAPGDVVVVDAGQRFGLAAADEATVLRVGPPIGRSCR